MPHPDKTDMDVFGHHHGGDAEAGGSDGHEIFDDDLDGFRNLQHPPELLPDEVAGMGAGHFYYLSIRYQINNFFVC